MHEFKPVIIKYCYNFQVGKCKFGEKCRYKHEIIPKFKKEDIFVDMKKKDITYNTNRNKISFRKIQNNVIGEINYTSDQFLVRTSYGYASTPENF